MNINAPKYTVQARGYFNLLLPNCRALFRAGDREEVGSRFKDDDYVLWVLESQSSPQQFGADPAEAINRALHEAAGSDHWYAHEKDYGDDRECAVDEIDDEDEEG